MFVNLEKAINSDSNYKIQATKDLEFLNINLLGLLNQLEFHLTFLEILIKIQIIANIIKKENITHILLKNNKNIVLYK